MNSLTAEQRKNCLKLADVLEAIPEDRFDMAEWGRESECGTTACALGWAVLSNAFPGLSAIRLRCYGGGICLAPAIDAVETSWGNAGRRYFGYDVWENVFLGGAAKREEVIEQLRHYGTTYGEEA